MADYLIDALHCDRCKSKNMEQCNDDCIWIPKNNEHGGECSHKCKARLTKGECRTISRME